MQQEILLLKIVEVQLLDKVLLKVVLLQGHGVVQFTETPGTIVFYIILGIAFVALLFYLLSAHRSPSTITFVVIVVIMAAGLIFNPEDKGEKNILKRYRKNNFTI